LWPSATCKDSNIKAGSEEVWEYLILHDTLSVTPTADSTFKLHDTRDVAHSLEVPAAVHMWLDALEDELLKIRDLAGGDQQDDIQTVGTSAPHNFYGLPSFLSFASRADATVALAPTASAVSHLGVGSDVAIVMGWPNRESFAAALTPEGPLAHGLLKGLPFDDMLWDHLRLAADESSTVTRDTEGEEGGVRLRVAWQRSGNFNTWGSNVTGDVLEVSLEGAPEPAHSDTWQGSDGEWCAHRAQAWGSTLRPSENAHPWLVLQPSSTRAIRLYRAADGKETTTSYAPMSAAEVAAEVENERGSRSVHLWFPTGEHSMQRDSVTGADDMKGHRRLLGSYYRELCATDAESFSTLIPSGCSSWYQDASSPWCSSSFGGSCNFCSSTGAEAGVLQLVYRGYLMDNTLHFTA